MEESERFQREFLRKDCGKMALAFHGEYTKEMASPLMIDHCAAYTYGGVCEDKLDKNDENLGNSTMNKELLNIFLIINFKLI